MFKLKYKEEDKSLKAIILYLTHGFTPAGYYDENENTIWIYWELLKHYPAYLIKVFLHEIIHWIVCLLTKGCRHTKFAIFLNRKNDDIGGLIIAIMFVVFPKGKKMRVTKERIEEIRVTCDKLSGHGQ